MFAILNRFVCSWGSYTVCLRGGKLSFVVGMGLVPIDVTVTVLSREGSVRIVQSK